MITIKYLFSLCIAAVLLWFTLRHTDLNMLWHGMGEARLWWVLLAFLTVNVGHVLRTHRWRYLLGRQHYGVPLAALWSALMIGYGANVVLPRMGEISRPLYLARTTSVSAAAGLASVLVERFLDLLILPVLLGIAFLGLGEVLYSTFSGPAFRTRFFGVTLEPRGMILCMLILCMVLGGLLLLLLRYNASSSGAWLRQRFPAVAVFLSNTALGLTALRQRRALSICAIDTLLMWVCYAGAMYVLTLSLDLGGTAANPIFQGVVLVLAGTIGLMFPTPGGLGSYAFAVSQALQAIYSVPMLQANTYALLGNAVLVILPGVLIASGILLLNGFRSRVPVPANQER